MILNATVTGWIFIAIGVIAMLGPALNWSVVRHPGKLFSLIFGNALARVIYFIAGVFLFMVGISKWIGVNWF